ncbi:alpha beta-hydrolase [Lactarius hatsudake]|nr:alpha beta-hydrolase [Lactarius hatsudake]
MSSRPLPPDALILTQSQTIMTIGQDAPQQQWPSIHDPATCTRKGLCPVTKLRGQNSPLESHSLYFEQHGTGPVKVVFVTGQASLKHFSQLSQYTTLVFDNRGAGNSGTPMGPYSTSGMAEDVVVLLDFVGWIENRSVHVVGLVDGRYDCAGCVKLAYRIPERFISLILAVTTAGGPPSMFNIPPGRTLNAAEVAFSSSWLDAKAENDPEGRTNREVQIMLYNERAAVTLGQGSLGAVSQMWAGFTHHVGAGRLAQISKTIPKVLILSGDQDHLVRSSNSAYLSKCMPEAEYVVWKETGHSVNEQHVERFNALLERVFLEGQGRLGGF